jgi:hypothetical protein
MGLLVALVVRAVVGVVMVVQVVQGQPDKVILAGRA